MKKILDLVAEPGTHKDQKLLDYIRKNYLRGGYVTNVCFIYGQETHDGQHLQPSAKELRKIVFEENDKKTIYFLASFYFDKEREAYLKLMEEMCEKDIQVFKTDQIEEHVTDDKCWTDKYCDFLKLEDLN